MRTGVASLLLAEAIPQMREQHGGAWGAALPHLRSRPAFPSAHQNTRFCFFWDVEKKKRRKGKEKMSKKTSICIALCLGYWTDCLSLSCDFLKTKSLSFTSLSCFSQKYIASISFFFLCVCVCSFWFRTVVNKQFVLVIYVDQRFLNTGAFLFLNNNNKKKIDWFVLL